MYSMYVQYGPMDTNTVHGWYLTLYKHFIVLSQHVMYLICQIWMIPITYACVCIPVGSKDTTIAVMYVHTFCDCYVLIPNLVDVIP